MGHGRVRRTACGCTVCRCTVRLCNGRGPLLASPVEACQAVGIATAAMAVAAAAGRQGLCVTPCTAGQTAVRRRSVGSGGWSAAFPYGSATAAAAGAARTREGRRGTAAARFGALGPGSSSRAMMAVAGLRPRPHPPLPRQEAAGAVLCGLPCSVLSAGRCLGSLHSSRPARKGGCGGQATPAPAPLALRAMGPIGIRFAFCGTWTAGWCTGGSLRRAAAPRGPLA